MVLSVSSDLFPYFILFLGSVFLCSSSLLLAYFLDSFLISFFSFLFSFCFISHFLPIAIYIFCYILTVFLPSLTFSCLLSLYFSCFLFLFRFPRILSLLVNFPSISFVFSLFLLVFLFNFFLSFSPFLLLPNPTVQYLSHFLRTPQALLSPTRPDAATPESNKPYFSSAPL